MSNSDLELDQSYGKPNAAAVAAALAPFAGQLPLSHAHAMSVVDAPFPPTPAPLVHGVGAGPLINTGHPTAPQNPLWSGGRRWEKYFRDKQKNLANQKALATSCRSPLLLLLQLQDGLSLS